MNLEVSIEHVHCRQSFCSFTCIFTVKGFGTFSSREREKRGQISVWISKETQTLYLNSERNEKQNKQKQLFIPRKSFSFLNQTKMYNFVYVSCLLYTKSSNALIPFDFNTSKVKVTQFWKELYHFRFPLLYRKWLLIINRNIKMLPWLPIATRVSFT